MLTPATVLWRSMLKASRIAFMSRETMTGPRRQQKQRLSASAAVAALAVWAGAGRLAAVMAVTAAVVLGIGIMAPQWARATPEDRLVVNADTGLAISGFDPVAYFTRKQPVLGKPALELTQNGAVWRFYNEGNRAAFAEHPEVYTPRFGGYDPVAIDRGVSVAGHPQIWVIEGERLYLFYDAKARTEFLANPGRIIESAVRKWPEVARTIAR
jgi:hypothetical protein